MLNSFSGIPPPTDSYARADESTVTRYGIGDIDFQVPNLSSTAPNLQNPIIPRECVRIDDCTVAKKRSILPFIQGLLKTAANLISFV